MQEDNKYRIYLSPPFQGGEELDYLKNALSTNWLAPGGPQVMQLEEELRKRWIRNYCVCLSSGTAAIHLALIALGVQRGDFVLCQTFTFVATANPISYIGALPVFIDSERNSWNIDADLLTNAILDLQNNGIKPKAIIYAHIYGNTADVAKLRVISKKYDIPLIEDAAEAIGTKIKEGQAGQFGDISIMSFNGNKVVTTGGGGALLTDNAAIASRVLALSTQSKDNKFHYLHTEVGYNYRMSNLNAAVGLSQLKFVDKWVSKKRAIFAHYLDRLMQIMEIEYFEESEQEYVNRWLSVFIVKSQVIRDQMIRLLNSNGIESRRFWKPLHTMGIYSDQRSYISGFSEELYSNGICLPSGVGLSQQEQQEVIDHIRSMI